MASRRSISDELQYKTKQDFNQISRKIFKDIHVFQMFFCDKGTAIPQTRIVFFVAFKQPVWPFYGLHLALFGFLLKFSSGNPAESSSVHITVQWYWN